MGSERSQNVYTRIKRLGTRETGFGGPVITPDSSLKRDIRLVSQRKSEVYRWGIVRQWESWYFPLVVEMQHCNFTWILYKYLIGGMALLHDVIHVFVFVWVQFHKRSLAIAWFKSVKMVKPELNQILFLLGCLSVLWMKCVLKMIFYLIALFFFMWKMNRIGFVWLLIDECLRSQVSWSHMQVCKFINEEIEMDRRFLN